MTTIDTSCNVASLAVYSPSNQNPWNRQKVNHLYRRLGFGASPEMVTNALNQNPSDLIDSLIDEAVNLNPTPAPVWGYWIREDFEATPENPFEYRRDWKNQMIEDLTKNNLRDRLTLFWSNHFVTESQAYGSPAYMFQYYNLLQLHAIGNFKDFTTDVGLTGAMLIYLNGYENTKNKPNENYGRELYELFTLGVDNGYTQNDIVETSRALTGWNKRERFWSPITFNPNKFDNENKTIFGKTGNWGYNDVINILFDERPDQIAEFICGKLYRYFVSPSPNEDIINQIAQTFKDNDFEISPVLRQLFKSEHFFDKKSQGVLIKSPSDVQIAFFKDLNLELPADFEFTNKIRGGCQELGQELLSPIDVAGWQGDKDWIDSSTLTTRWDRLSWYLWRSWRHNEEQFRAVATNIMGGNSNNVELVSRSIMNNFLAKELTNATEYSQALEIFKDQVPDNYFEDGTWDLNWSLVPKQVYRLLQFIITIPEFQLK
ncbi:DUF1800 family protein [Aquimarina sp. RZ0]|uniref:DUF1800 domain-containing protein n=1 Tax=Aquimarina sp. RZ0 TaxID=2607730 RepID=UPI0011F27EF6|nr:DUF1800 domain-containing protein [Aquimarina sp. RZ0]KAA1246202.1 DUF1800 domain-containing protein [Aquimarina sp. RZ0]